VAVVVVVVMVDVIVVVVKVVVEVVEATDGFLCGGSGDSCCWSIPTDTPKSPPPPPPPTPSRSGRIRVYGGGGGGGAWPDAADSALPIVVRNSHVHSHMVPVFSFFSVVGFPRAVAAAAASEF
jgi:hypothetical protein